MHRSLQCITSLPALAPTVRGPTKSPAHGATIFHEARMACCDKAGKGPSMFQVVVQLKRRARVFTICDSHAEFGRMPPTTMQRLETFLCGCSPMYADTLDEPRRVRVFEGGKCRATIRDNFSAAVLFLHLEDIKKSKRLAEALDASGIFCGSVVGAP